MRTKSLNRSVFKLDDDHPAKKFLRAFIACKENCVGRHHDWTGEVPIEQQWTSATDGRVWTFSGFAYSFLSFDIVLEGFLKNTPSLTDDERYTVKQIPLLRSLMQECAQAAQQDDNREILPLIDQVMQMLSLWEEYLRFREGMISQSEPKGSSSTTPDTEP
jgi:hypothetical protein